MSDVHNHSPLPEAKVIADLAVFAVDPTVLAPGEVYGIKRGDSVEILDTDKYDDHPRRATGRRTVTDAASFVKYVEKHGEPETEVWAHTSAASVVGVINAHGHPNPGWGDHTVTLALEKTPAWKAWIGADQQWFNQIDFAEFIELRAIDVVSPTHADLIDLAQKFQAKKSVEFESSERMNSGEVALEYKETIKALAGVKGKITIPDFIELAVTPYYGGPRYSIRARFRYRIGTDLKLGIVLERPQEILDQAFADIVTDIREGKTKRVRDKETGEITSETRIHEGISSEIPILYGKP